MREIKFRAWDPQVKKMFDMESMDLGGMLELAEYRGVSVMQYTGLKDKNGREIFEGDICRLTQHHRPYNDVIGWHDNGFWFTGFQGHYLPTKEYIEVIGNIYANSDLLKP